MIALTRAVSPDLGHCQLSHLPRTPIDVRRAGEQHAGYERALASLGCRILRVPPAADLADSVFVEDTAVVVDEVAVMARPGALARRPEVGPVAAALADHRPVRWIETPGTLDGGDVLTIGRAVWVGISTRTNRAGADQLRSVLEPLGYDVRCVPVGDCLHLKSAVTALTDETLLVNGDWVDPGRFPGYDMLRIDPGEPHAANVLRIGDAVLMPASHRRTGERIAARGLRVVEVDVTELAKAEGGVTCCCILLRDRSGLDP